MWTFSDGVSQQQATSLCSSVSYPLPRHNELESVACHRAAPLHSSSDLTHPWPLLYSKLPQPGCPLSPVFMTAVLGVVSASSLGHSRGSIRARFPPEFLPLAGWLCPGRKGGAKERKGGEPQDVVVGSRQCLDTCQNKQALLPGTKGSL